MKRKTSMNRHTSGITTLAIALCAGMASAGDPDFDPDFGFDFVTITDPGNEPYVWQSVPRGGVDYEYRIARMELTSGQYLEYFNIFLTNDLHEFYELFPNGTSGLDEIGPGIPAWLSVWLVDPANSGVGLNFKKAAMFCNWLHNGQSSDRASLMDGAYDISTFVGPDPKTGNYSDQSAHHPDARYWIPTYDELLKASFYDPDKDGNGPGWWEYPHSSDEPAIIGLPGVGEVARGLSIDVLAPLYGSGVVDGTIPLGIYPDVQSPWGLLDTLGGTHEWTETWQERDDGRHRRRLSRWSSNIDYLGKDLDGIRNIWATRPTSHRYGLRIASAVPPAGDLDRNWKVDWFDVGYFLERYFAGDLEVDLDESGELDINDVWVFLEMVS